LTGSFVFAVTGSGLSPGEKLSQYIADGATSRVAFAATAAGVESEIASFEDAVFYNLNIGESGLMPKVLAEGFVGRIWKTNEAGYWRRASFSCANHIATDELDTARSPWANTKNENGWPFFCFDSLGVDCSSLSE
jgi:hypothetical protein